MKPEHHIAREIEEKIENFHVACGLVKTIATDILAYSKGRRFYGAPEIF